MKSIFVVAFVSSVLYFDPCFAQSSKTDIEKKIAYERLKLKNYAFCKCLIKSYPKDSLLRTDGSVAGYFELSAYSLDVFDGIDSLAILASAKKYSSKHGSPLAMMKCLDFYNSKELDNFVLKLDDELDISLLRNEQ